MKVKRRQYADHDARHNLARAVVRLMMMLLSLSRHYLDLCAHIADTLRGGGGKERKQKKRKKEDGTSRSEKKLQ